MQTLRIGIGARRRGIAVIDRDHQSPSVVGVDGNAHAGRGQRIGRAAARQIGGGDRRPAPGAVQEEAAALADEELGVGRKLAKADRHLVVEQMLLEPHLEQARGVGCLEIGDRHQAADIGGGDRVAVNLIAIGEEAEALPQAELLHVGIDVELEHAVILAALVEAAPIVESLAVIGPADADAGFGKAGAGSADIGLEGHVLGDAVRHVGHVAIGFGRGGQDRTARRQSEADRRAKAPAPICERS